MMMPYLVTGGGNDERQKWIHDHLDSLDIFTGDLYQLSTEQSVGIDEIRALKRWFMVKPLSGGKKAAVIHHADNLTLEAQNALLKLLEEPPASSVILLAAISQHNLLPTVISRCLVVILKKSRENSEDRFSEDATSPTITQLQSATRGKRLEYAGLLAAEPEKAKLWLEQTLRLYQPQLATSTSIEVHQRVQRLLRLEEILQTSTNLRLALEHVFLHW